MAYSFLQAINASLKRVGIIQGDAGELTTFSDDARQTDIDIMIDSWNEAIDALYDIDNDLPVQVAESGTTLVTSTREYSFPANFEGLSDPIIQDETNGHQLLPYPGGFEQMRRDQPQPGNHTGQPSYYVVNPTNGKLRLDTTPTANENGNVYKYMYTKRLNLSVTTDTFAFSDTVVDQLLPAVVEIWNRERKKKFDASRYQGALAQSAEKLLQMPPSERW